MENLGGFSGFHRALGGVQVITSHMILFLSFANLTVVAVSGVDAYSELATGCWDGPASELSCILHRRRLVFLNTRPGRCYTWGYFRVLKREQQRKVDLKRLISKVFKEWWQRWGYRDAMVVFGISAFSGGGLMSTLTSFFCLYPIGEWNLEEISSLLLIGLCKTAPDGGKG